MDEIKLSPNERIDDLQYNDLKLIQNPDSFCFGCDAVELANFVGAGRGRLCDLGAGNGIISVLTAAKKGYHVTAVEIQKEAAQLCEKNVRLNGLEDKISVLNVPMQELVKTMPKGSFDAVVSNPPYLKTLSGDMAPADSIAIARHELCISLKELIEVAAHLLKFGGKFYLVYPTARLSEVLTLCVKSKLEPKVLQVLVPNIKKEPHLFLLECKSGAKVGLKVLKERVVDTIV